MSQLPAQYLILSDGAHPTEALYFRYAIPYLKNHGVSCYSINTQAKSPFFTPKVWYYLSKHTHVVITRSLPLSWAKWLERHKKQLGKIFYILDDDMDAAAADNHLPQKYRERMSLYSIEIQPRLFSISDEVIVCSKALKTRLQHLHDHVSILTPALISPLPSLDFQETSPTEIGFHGTRSHLNDLEQIIPVLTKSLERYPELAIEVMLGKFTPKTLSSLNRVSSPSPMGWNTFLNYQRSRRIHIGVAPLWPTSFNHAKSWIKFLDISVMGGVGIFSNREPYSEIVENGINGLLVNDSAEDWLNSLTFLIEHPLKRLEMAKNAAITARRIGNPEQGQLFWFDRAIKNP